jgi:hypothetical protein
MCSSGSAPVPAAKSEEEEEVGSRKPEEGIFSFFPNVLLAQ